MDRLDPKQMASPEKYVFDSSEGLVESMLGRQLIPEGEHPLMRAARQWLSENGCPRKSHVRGRGAYLVTAELAEGFRGGVLAADQASRPSLKNASGGTSGRRLGSAGAGSLA